MSGFEKIKAGLEDAIAFARGDETRGTLHTVEAITKRNNDRKGLGMEKAAKAITRSDLIEIIARAAFDGLGHSDYVGSPGDLGSVVLDGNFDLKSTASAILAALSSAGLTVVPREALPDAIRRPMGVIPKSAEGWVTTAELDAAERRRTMVAAEDLAGERG